MPPGAEGVATLVTSPRLEAGQVWSTQPDTLEVGDALTRTVRLEAVDVSGMAFPPLVHDPIEGVGTYPGNPEVDDRANRGALTGRRVDVVTYVMERAGPVRLPDVQLAWWNPETELLEPVVLPGQEFVVAAPPLAAEELVVPERPSTSPWWGFAIWVVALALVILVAGRSLASARRRRRELECHFFREAMKRLGTGEAAPATGALLVWLDRLEDGEVPARVDRFMQRYGDERGREGLTQLETALAAGEPVTDPARLVADWKRARREWNRARRARGKAEELLPRLNS
jgi:hypothetical protein